MNRRRLSIFDRPMLLLMSVIVLMGCANDPTQPEGKIRTIDPVRPDAEPGLLLPGSDPVRWVSRRLSFPLGQPVEDAWALANEGVLNELSRAVWNGNGLRLGVMSASRGPAFAVALRNPADRRDTQLLSYDFPEEMRESPPLRAEFFADLTIPPRPVTMEFFTRGRLRMLMSSRPLGNGSTRVTLTPQHYLRRTTLLPRSPQERKLDGRVFDELAVKVTIGPREILLLGFFQPAPPAEDTEETAPPDEPKDTDPPSGPEPSNSESSDAVPELVKEQNDSESQPMDEDPIEEAEAVNLPLNLGRGLFTTGINDDDQQFLFLLRPLP